MKAGVRIGPRGVAISPRRAPPSVFRSLKAKRSVMGAPARGRAGRRRRRNRSGSPRGWRARAIEGRGRLGGNLTPFGVHAMLRRVIGLDGQEGAGADMQRDAMA